MRIFATYMPIICQLFVSLRYDYRYIYIGRAAYSMGRL